MRKGEAISLRKEKMEKRRNKKKNNLIVLIIVSLFLFAAIADAGARRGCCSRHDGVEKYTCWHGGIGYRCGDGTSLSATCDPYYAECSEYTSPQVVTKKTTSITATSATLEGNLDSTGAPIALEPNHSGSISCQVWFEYGTTTSYGRSTTKRSKSSSGTFSKPISGLSPGTTYHFRAVATSGVGTDYGSDMSFETSTPTPTPTPELTPSPTPSQSPASDVIQVIDNETLRIGAFNIQVFGKSKASKPEVMDVLADIIRTYDIVAIQEIRDKDQTALPQLVDLVNSKGVHYNYVVGPRLGRSASKEQYAFIYNNRTVNLNGTAWTYPEPNGTDPFHREPYIAAFQAVNGSFDITLIVIHTDPDEATEEIYALDAVLNHTKSAYPDEQDFIILGDLNADCSYFDEDSNCSICGSDYFWCINNSIDTTTSTTNCTYDRIIITEGAVSDYTGDSGVLRYDIVYNLTEEETKAVSDHYPIYAEFYCAGDIITPEKEGSLIPTTGPITPTPTPTATLFEKIEGLTAIMVVGGSWENWDADMENDGPVILIMYLDARGELIIDENAEKVPISADVKLYAGDSFLDPYDKLVFSAHYTEDEIIFGLISPSIRIPKEEISVNPSTDYMYGAVEVTIYTPAQGSFADRCDFIQLYEE